MDKILYKYFETPMDYLQKRISKFNFYQSREHKDDIIPFSNLVRNIYVPRGAGYYYNQRDRILSIVRDTNKKIKELYRDYDERSKEEKQEIKVIVSEIKQECVEYINDMSISEGTMYLLLLALDKKENSDIKNRIFNTLFGTPNKTFFKMIIDNQGDIKKIEEQSDGDILLYDLRFSIV